MDESRRDADAPPEPTATVGSPSVRVRVGIGAAVVLVVVALVCSVLVTALSPVGATTVFGGSPPGAGEPTSESLPSGASGSDPTSSPPEPSSPESSSTDSGGVGGAEGGAAKEPGAGGTSATILVHVLGAVVSPGVYELPEASRVIDVVAAAGGLAETADPASVNLARVLVDGEQLRILAVGEAPPLPMAGSAGAGAGAGVGAGVGGSGSASAGGASGAAGTGGAAPIIDLNSATELDLDGLPRIGPAMAARIVAFRADNGPFASVDDLLQIPGIGDKTLEALRPLVTV